MAPTSLDSDDDLDLPPLDGLDGEVDESDAAEELDDLGDAGDALDDATGESDPIDIAVEGAEGGWLSDADDAESLDVGAFDLGLSTEEKVLEDDEPDTRIPYDDLTGANDERVTADGGEEGPLDEDEVLREEDLPALDADDDGDVADETLFDGAMLAEQEELRWDDRAWARAEALPEPSDDGEDSGLLAVPDDKQSPRDATWRRLEEGGRLTAAALLPGGGVVVAVDERSRAMLVRILPDGAARIIAEVEGPAGAADDDGEPLRVTALRWHAASGCLLAMGSFGVQAFRPA